MRPRSRLLTAAGSFLIMLMMARMSYGADEPVFDNVPTSYAECMQTDTRYSMSTSGRSALKCEYVVRGGVTGSEFSESDRRKVVQCERMGGHNPSYEQGCGLRFYNPGYVFPTSYEDCVNGNKGEVSTSVRPNCVVDINTLRASNTEDTQRLIQQCTALGGDYSEEFGPRCFKRFERP